MALDIVSDYVTEARILTQDTVAPFRYPDIDLVLALNMAVLESRRLRPDLWLGVTTLPSFVLNDATPVVVDPQYRVAFLYYICGQAQLRDEEETQDTRAAAFLQMFKNHLTAL
jgi:hypothetical protein